MCVLFHGLECVWLEICWSASQLQVAKNVCFVMLLVLRLSLDKEVSLTCLYLFWTSFGKLKSQYGCG